MFRIQTVFLFFSNCIFWFSESMDVAPNHPKSRRDITTKQKVFQSDFLNIEEHLRRLQKASNLNNMKSNNRNSLIPCLTPMRKLSLTMR